MVLRCIKAWISAFARERVAQQGGKSTAPQLRKLAIVTPDTPRSLRVANETDRSAAPMILSPPRAHRPA